MKPNLPEFYCSVYLEEGWRYPTAVEAVSEPAAVGKYIQMLVSDGHPLLNSKQKVYVHPSTVFEVSVNISTIILSENTI